MNIHVNPRLLALFKKAPVICLVWILIEFSSLRAAIILEVNTFSNEITFTVNGGSTISSGDFDQWFTDDGNVMNQTAASFLTITNFSKTGGTGLSSSAEVGDFRFLKLFASPSTVNSFVLGGTSAFSNWSGTITGSLSSGTLSGITTYNTINNNARGSTSPALSGAPYTPVVIPEPKLVFFAAAFLVINQMRRKR